MRDLLERWAQLEPERVHIGPPLSDIGADIRLGGVPFWVTFDTFGVEAPAIVLAATIEAIEARGWTWEVRRDLQGGYPSRVWPLEVGRPVTGWSRNAPAEALLTAYLAAIEAEAAS